MVRGLTILRWGGELGQCTAGTFRIGEAVKRVCIRAAWLNALEHPEIDETAERAVGAWLDPFLLEGRRGVFEAGSDAADQLGRLVGGSHHGVVAIHVRDAIDGHAREMVLFGPRVGHGGGSRVSRFGSMTDERAGIEPATSGLQSRRSPS